MRNNSDWPRSVIDNFQKSFGNSSSYIQKCHLKLNLRKTKKRGSRSALVSQAELL